MNGIIIEKWSFLTTLYGTNIIDYFKFLSGICRSMILLMLSLHKYIFLDDGDADVDHTPNFEEHEGVNVTPHVEEDADVNLTLHFEEHVETPTLM